MGRASEGGVAFAVMIVVFGGLLGCSVVAWRSRPFRLVVPVLASVVALLLISPTFFPHYVGALAVPVALVIGVATGMLTSRPGRTGWRVAVVIIGCACLAVDAVALSRIRSGDQVPPELEAAVHPAPECLTTDDPNNLLRLGVVGRNVDRDCELVVDLGGYSHHTSRGTTLSRGRNLAWQQIVLEHLGSGHYALPTRFGRGRGYAASTATEIESWPLRLRVDGYELRQPPR